MAEELPSALTELALVLAATASKNASQALSKANEVNERAQFAKGENGDPGQKGDRGDRGQKGDKGDPGQKGDKGDTGQKGDKGDLGQKGDKGDPGQKGDKGDAGQKGDKGDKGDPGQDGVGISSLEQPFPEILRFKFTNGKAKDVILPKGKDGKDAKPSRQPVNIIHQHFESSAVAGNAVGRQEVFIGELPEINYPAVGYSLIPGTNLYRQSINVLV